MHDDELLDPSPGALQRSGLNHDGGERYHDGEHGVRFHRKCERGLRRLGDRDQPHDRKSSQGGY